jgi:hypothetical protein
MKGPSFSRFSLRPNSLSWAIGLFLFSLYLLSFSGKFHVMDELAVFSAGHNLAQHGRADIDQLIWTNHWTPNPPGVWGQDGHLYTKKPPGISFFTAPLIGLGRAIPGLNAVHVGLLTNALVTALTAALLYLWLSDVGFSRPAAALASLGYGMCTIAWVYARMFWESSLLALAFLVALWSLHRAVYLAQPARRPLWLLVCGLAVAVGLSLRFEAALAILLIGLFLVVNQRVSESAYEHSSGLHNEQPLLPMHQVSSIRDQVSGIRYQVSGIRYQVSRITFYVSRLMRPIAIYLAPSLLATLVLLYFNFVRFGSLGETGYSQEISFRAPWTGAFGLLFSPGRGLFIYAPLLWLLFFGLRPAWRRLPRLYFWLIAAVCLGYWLFYGAWFAWGGTGGWGPRFLLPVLPPLMLFVAEPLEWLGGQGRSGLKSGRLWVGVGVLALLSLVVNLLGVAVDFNQHFLRLGSNENFVFNWAAFPPLAHWRILQEGLVDLIWLRPTAAGLQPIGPLRGIEWPALLPALILFVLATAYLIITYYVLRITYYVSRFTIYVSRFTLHAFVLIVAIGLTWLTVSGAARIPLTGEQAKSDWAVLEALAASARPGDALLVAMPPFGDVQEVSTLLMAYLEPALPTYAWIESEPRGIQPEERERVWRAVQAEAKRVWLFERWLIPGDATGVTAADLNQEAFPIQERWFAQSGKLTLYALADGSRAAPPATPLNLQFEGGLALVDYAVANDQPLAPGDILKLRLTWRATALPEPAAQDIQVGEVIAFAQLLDPAAPGRKVAQNDRLLVDVQHLGWSPLQPGQTVPQGYGLALPADLPPGSYPLIVGLYYAADGRRLPRADGSPDDFVYVTDVLVR